MSIGVAIGRVDANFSDLTRRADTALYAAEAAGRNRVATGDDARHPEWA